MYQIESGCVCGLARISEPNTPSNAGVPTHVDSSSSPLSASPFRLDISSSMYFNLSRCGSSDHGNSDHGNSDHGNSDL